MSILQNHFTIYLMFTNSIMIYTILLERQFLYVTGMPHTDSAAGAELKQFSMKRT